MSEIICGDCLDVMRGMADNSVDLIVTDPPYYRVKNLAWDKQWDSADGFIDWIGELCEQWQRILKPNGSLYVFASPKMAARVEVKIGERFDVLNRVRWQKEAGWHNKALPEALRSYLSPWEEIIFAEQRGFLFEPLRAYLQSERKQAGMPMKTIDAAWCNMRNSKGAMIWHWFGRAQWALPTAENYQWLRETLGSQYLRREYEDLRREYEDLRRPFTVTADVPYTDVWDFATVQSYAGKYPCEKPLDMMRHIVKASSKPGAVVLDCFCGSGNTLIAAQELGREYIGIDISEHWCNAARRRLACVQVALL